MKHHIFLLAMLTIVISCNSQPSLSKIYPEKKLGWELGCVSYDFKYFTFLEALDKIDSCGLKYVEGFPKHLIGGRIMEKLDYHMDELTIKQILQKLKEKGIKLVAYGVVSPKSESDWRQLFEFGKKMGIKTFTSEPDEKFMPLLSKLCDRYKINIAIHNHTYPSHYWNPDIVLNAIKGQSKRIGACTDIAHWVESGLNPVACLKKLEGHVLHLHLADLNEKNNKDAQSVPWGTGVSDINGITTELKRQQFKGMISAEYESNWYNSVPDITASIIYFRKLLNKQQNN